MAFIKVRKPCDGVKNVNFFNSSSHLLLKSQKCRSKFTKNLLKANYKGHGLNHGLKILVGYKEGQDL